MFLILCSLLGAAVVMLISHLNSQIDERTLGSYTTPFMIGLISGALVGFLQNRLFHQQQAREELFIDLIEVMAVTLEERDQYTHGHAHRVTQLARMLGKSAKLDEAQLNNLRLASILHDIGKIGIPDEVLLKQAPLSEDEFTIIKSHPDKGARILGKLRDARMEPIVLAVGHHHERYDGQGYPDGLCCHEILLCRGYFKEICLAIRWGN